jgi:hypothetical protein
MRISIKDVRRNENLKELLTRVLTALRRALVKAVNTG